MLKVPNHDLVLIIKHRSLKNQVYNNQFHLLLCGGTGGPLLLVFVGERTDGSVYALWISFVSEGSRVRYKLGEGGASFSVHFFGSSKVKDDIKS